MGPVCIVLLSSASAPVFDQIDALLASVAERIERTRKGRVWDVWIQGSPVHVHVVASPPSIELSAGRNSTEDSTILRELADKLVQTLGGIASEPFK